MSGRGERRRVARLLAAVAAVTALAVSPVLVGPAVAASTPTPDLVTVSTVTGDAVMSPVTGDAKPRVITAVGHTVNVTVSLWSSGSAPVPAAFKKDTTIALTSGGQTVTSTFVAGATSQSFTTAPFTTAVNQTTVTVSFPGLNGRNGVPPASSPTQFDVLHFVSTDSAGAGYSRNVGKNGEDCGGTVDADHPYCATVLLPNGGGDIVIGTGACDDTAYTACDASSSFVLELLADLSGYSATSPATVILSCDKVYCGNGSIKRNVPSFTTSGNGDLSALPPCPAKGQALATGACVDYVQSTRDNAGDTHLWVLFARDARMSCC